MQAPEEQFVVVTAGGQLLLVEGPFQAANLLFVAVQFPDVIGRASDVSSQNGLVLGARSQ